MRKRGLSAILLLCFLTALTLSVSAATQEKHPVISYVQEAGAIPCPPDCTFYGHHGYKPGDPLCTPDYSIQIFDDGLVIYSGQKNVAIRGEQRAWISKDALLQLKNSFIRARFLEFKRVEINPETGMTTHDCQQDEQMLSKYGLAELCRGKDKVQRFERMRLERNWPETVLFFRQGSRSKQLRNREVSLGADAHQMLGQEVNDAVGSNKWVQPISCEVRK